MPKTIDGTPARLFTAIRTTRTSGALPGIFAQVERGEHPERRHREGHQEDHQHGAEDGREDPAFGVRFARIAGDELTRSREVEPQLGQAPHLVRTDRPYHRADRHLLGLAGRGLHHQRLGLVAVAQVGEAGGEAIVPGLADGDLALDRGLAAVVLGRRDLPAAGRQIELLLVEAQAFDVVIDVADRSLLQRVDLIELAELPFMERARRRARRRRGRRRAPSPSAAARPWCRRSSPTPAARASRRRRGGRARRCPWRRSRRSRGRRRRGCRSSGGRDRWPPPPASPVSATAFSWLQTSPRILRPSLSVSSIRSFCQK